MPSSRSSKPLEKDSSVSWPPASNVKSASGSESRHAGGDSSSSRDTRTAPRRKSRARVKHNRSDDTDTDD
jgi:hypothetical protein